MQPFPSMKLNMALRAWGLTTVLNLCAMTFESTVEDVRVYQTFQRSADAHGVGS